ncbi:M48 family metallopeptidase [Roseibium sp. CAU 1637]|uniref:M48 family metallopeptidase n=1 Tax=Roseibium limicola TaxID=2816037 RepID=A0A939J6T6_9HYPH|nr:SprT family zinc-dependent metalloprotease [Roseibium limicola]MBO0347210.1 M48 family metallopeptidase [Roseibium limicola]
MLLRGRRKLLPPHIEISTESGPLRIRLRPDPRAKRYLLRLPADASGPVMTVPKNADLKRAERFALAHVDWLLERMDQRPDPVAMAPGDIIPLRGEDHLICPTGKLRGLVRQVACSDPDRLGVPDASGAALPELHVPGEAEHVPRKLTTWLKAQARKDLEQAVSFHAQRLGKPYAAISVRDTRSRWGSCASNGRLSFSWRLILAPPEILDYVAAHEVAHLAEMNHSDRFWAVCEELAPHTRTARKWLKDNGVRLHGYG